MSPASVAGERDELASRIRGGAKVGTMRSRNLKPGFFDNELLAECEPLSRILFEGLWCYVDRDGRCEERIKKIKVKLLPYDDCDLCSLLSQLAERDFITRYDVDGRKYIQVNTFGTHQTPHVREPSKGLPPPPQKPDQSTVQDSDKPASGILPASECSKRETGRGKQETGNSNQDSAAAKKLKAVTVADVKFPTGFDIPDCREVVAQWLEHKQRRGESYKTPKHLGDVMLAFQRDGPEAFIAAVRWAMGVNYAGIVPPKSKPPERGRLPTQDEFENWNPTDGGSG